MDYTIRISGSAGQGTQTVGGLLSETFALMGYHVFTIQDYESRVRGGHNFYQIRVSDRRITSSTQGMDIHIALDPARGLSDMHQLNEGGVMVHDAEGLGSGTDGPAGSHAPGNPNVLDIPFRRLAVEGSGSPVMANTVAMGAVTGMLGLSTGMLEELLGERFRHKGPEVVQGNISSVRAGHAYAREHCTQCSFLPAPQGRRKRLIDGHESAAMGALASGIKFYCAYPMTPSTGIMNHIAKRAGDFGVVVEQTEDEIASINMALGASFAGVRAATGSSGGGFALMVEGLSLAAITETPIVIFEVQRPGPATGLPTRTEQADLLFIIHTGHGEFPRVVFTPGSPRQNIMLTNKAFDMAEKYQIPVFVVFDQYLADSQWTYDGFDTKALVYKDHRLSGEAARKLEGYARHALTTDGISPLLVPGKDHEHLVVTDSDEHDEEGHLTEDAAIRNSMVEKRLHKKLDAIRAGMSPPMHYGSPGAETVLICWGSTYGVLRETVDALNEMGGSACMLFFSEIYPLPRGDYVKTLEGAARTVCIEGNATGQFASLLKSETGFEVDHIINRYDGRPLTARYILERL